MREFAGMRNLDVWYARFDVETLLADMGVPARLKAARKNVARAHEKDSLKAFDRLVRVVDGEPQIISDPPLLVPAQELLSKRQMEEFEERVLELLDSYRESLSMTGGTCSTATGSSIWRARWLASEAS
jgi:Uncharacterized protein conserved in bacteria (DUF2252)